MINKKIVSRMIVFVFIFNLFSNLVLNRVYAAGSQLVINTSVDKTSVNTGDVFTYTLKYANPSTTQHSNNVIIMDVLPNNVQYVSYESSFDVKSVDVSGNTVIFTFKDPLMAGSTGYIRVAAKFLEGTTLNGTTADNTPTITDTNGSVSSNTVTVTAKTLATQNWNVAKTLVNPPTTPAVDQPLTYKIQVNGNSTSGGVNLTNIRGSDTIPEGATFISATDGGTYSAGKVNWDAFDLNVGASKSFYVTIAYPSTTFTIASTVTNNVTAIADDISGSADVTKTASAQHGFTDPTYSAGGFTKSSRQDNDEYCVDDTAYFYLSNISNTGNVPLNKFIITDTIPAGFNLTSITPGQFSSASDVKITYDTNTKTAQPWGDFSSPSNQVVNVSGLSLSGETITKVTLEISATGGLPAGFANTASIKLTGTLLGNPVNTTLTNTAQLTAQIGVAQDPVKDIVKNAAATIKVIDNLPWPIATKSINGATSVNMGDTVTYDIRIKNHQYATGGFKDPVALDILPPELENYVLDGYKKNGADYTPDVAFNQNGQELKWSFTETLNPGDYIDIIYKANVKDKTLVGAKRNNLYVGSDSQTIFQYKANAVADTVGLAPSPMVTSYVDTFVKFTGSLTAKKLVKGQLDADWGYYGDLITYGETLPGGIADYQLQVSNNGSNGPISNIVIIDQLPSINDIGVIDTSIRGSQWTPYLVNKIICVDDSGNPSSLPSGTKIYYSTIAHPSKVELSNSITNGAATPGGTGDGWSETPPSDITTVKSLKFDFGSYELAASGKITLQWPMRAPVGAETSKVAWNSFGYGATYPDATGNSSFLPSEPIKVGFEIHRDPSTYKVGNYVWEDMNKDGIQNEGTTSGINGILVNLYTETTPGSGTYDNKVSYTRTGFDQANNPGYYLFPNLQTANYQVEFVYPTNYKVTDFNIGADTTKNSKIGNANRTVYNIPGDLDDGKYSIKAAPITINGSDNIDQDAGLYRVATLGDYVWNDANLDGVENDSKPKLSGIKVDILNTIDQSVINADGNSVGQVTTDVDGKYIFTNLMPGSYHVKFTDPTGYFVFSNSGIADGTHSVPDKTTGIATVTIKSNESNIKIDAGLHLAQIGDFVWHDKNADGIQNDGTSGITGVKVDLVDSLGAQLNDHYGNPATTNTGGNGKYLFDSLDPGTYYVKITMPSGYTKISPKNVVSATGPTDSNMNTTTLTSDAVILSAGQTDFTIDVGLYNLAKLGDKVWKDLNGNGLQDTTYNGTTEVGIQGVIVKLFDVIGHAVIMDGNGDPIVDQVTDINGLYNFSNLTPGSYVVKFENPDTAAYVFSPKSAGSDSLKDSNANVITGLTATIILKSGDNNASIDAGLHKGVLGDFVWTDTNGNGIQDAGETGIKDVTVNLYDGANNKIGTTTTNGSGYYEFDDLSIGTFHVEFKTPTGYQYTDPNKVGTAVTDSDAGLITGITPPIIKLTAGFVDKSWDAGMWKPASIGDFLWEDKNGNGIQEVGENGINDVTVFLYKQGIPIAIQIITTGNKDNNIANPGYFLFDNLTPGNYSLKFDMPTGYDAFTFNNKGGNLALDSDVDMLGATNTTALISDEKDMSWDAGVYKFVTLGDKVWRDTNMNGTQDSGEPGLVGVTINLYKYNGSSYVSKAFTTTDGIGNYIFDKLEPGQYKVEVVKPFGYSFTAKDIGADNGIDSDAKLADGKTTDIILTSEQADYTWDAGLYKLATVGDFVWNDENANGIQELGESGVPGVVVQLFDKNSNLITTTTTGVLGEYSFTNIQPGDYYLKLAVPAHYTISEKNQWGDDSKDSDVDASTLKTDVFTLTEGQDDLTWDMGIYKLSSIGDYVFEDMNADGIQDGGDKPLANFTVRLLDLNNNVIQTTTTDGNGKYLFDDLKKGDYSVQFVNNGYVFSPKESGSNTDLDSNADVTGKKDKITLGIDQHLTDIDAGLYKLATIGDYVWLDKNNDGKQDATEPGISGITVNLLDKVGYLVLATTTTDGTGKYSFTNLVPGEYFLEFVSSKDFYKHTDANIGNDSKDSDADKATGKTDKITVKSGENNLTIDAGFTVKTGITIEKTVYAGHDGGAGTGTELVIGEKGTLVTYLFKVTNTGDTYLNNVEINDITLDIDKSKMTYKSGAEQLPPGASLVYYYEASINGDLTNTANTTGTPSDNLGATVPNIDKPTELDTAKVDEVKPEIDVQKSIYFGEYNSGTSGEETASGKNGEWVTYVFTVTNTGDTYLKSLVINDITLGVDKSKMTIINGAEPLAPGAKIHYYYQTQINGDLINTVTVTGTPSDSDGNVLQNTKNPTDEDTANAKALGSIGDYLWHDNNGNGTQDSGESSLSGVKLNLLDNEGKVVVTTTTDSNGLYIFDRLIPGEYTVVVDITTLPAGLKQTYELDGNIDGSVKVTLTPGQEIDTVDFGYYKLGIIGDYVWGDINGNGIQEAGENGIQDVTVRLYNVDGTLVNTTTTDVNGLYKFDDLVLGDYYIQFVKPTVFEISEINSTEDKEIDSDAASDGKTVSIKVVAGTNDMTWDAGLYVPASLGDYLWYDINGDEKQDLGEPSLPGVKLNLLDKNGNVAKIITTDSNGKYIFEKLIPGEYTVAVDSTTLPEGLKQTYELDGNNDGRVNVTLTPGQEVNTIDFGYYKLGVIGNYVWEDTNANGIQDGSEKGIEDVTVELYKTDNTLVKTTKTDVNGLYKFDDLVLGDYYIKFVKSAGFEVSKIYSTEDKAIDSDATSDGKTVSIKVVAGTDDMSWDAGMYKYSSVGDYVWNDINVDGKQDTYEKGIPNISVILTDAMGNTKSTVTDANGKYIFGNLVPGDYSISIVKTTLPFSLLECFELDKTLNNKVTFTLVSGEGKNDVDFGYYVPVVPILLGSIGDTVWADNNLNGLQDMFEIGIPNVIVNLLDGYGKKLVSTTTDITGKYLFKDMIPGVYMIEVIKPYGYNFTLANQGNNDLLNSDVDKVTGKTALINLKPGENIVTVDAGMYKLSSVGDYVWNDKNGDGLQNTTEKGIPDVKVTLTDAQGLVITIVTDNSGKYIFENLMPGSYTVSIDKTTLPKDLKGTYELDKTLDGKVDVSLASGQFKDDVDFGYNKNGVGIDDDFVPGGEADLKASLGDYVWYDINGNGKQESNEKCISGVKIILTDSQGISRNTTTDDLGKYIFKNLPLGKYTVSIDKTTLPKGVKETYELDKTFDGKVEVTLITAEFKDDVDFGYNKNGIGIDDEDIPEGSGDIRTSVGDYVWHDINGNGKQEPNEKGIAGVKLILTDFYGNEMTTITDSLGKYIFKEISIAKYTITIDKKTLPKDMKETYELDKTLDDKVEVTLITAKFKDDVDFGYNKSGVGFDDDKVPGAPSNPEVNNLPKTGTENYNLLLSGIFMLLLSSAFIMFYRRKES